MIVRKTESVLAAVNSKRILNFLTFCTLTIMLFDFERVIAVVRFFSKEFLSIISGYHPEKKNFFFLEAKKSIFLNSNI